MAKLQTNQRVSRRLNKCELGYHGKILYGICLDCKGRVE